MSDLRDLERTLLALDGKGYGAYKRIRGAWGDDRLLLEVEHVQGDPFATPSRLRVRLPESTHRLPRGIWNVEIRRTALCDYLLRAFAGAARRLPRGEGMGHSGKVLVDAGDAEILARSGCILEEDGTLELRFRVGLPARGRTVLGRAAARLLADLLPQAAESVCAASVNLEEAERWADTAEEHAHLQALLPRHGLVAFVPDGAILPRASGVSSKPMEGAVPFAAPESLAVTLPTLRRGDIRGMGIPEGVTLITGGGFHGKTTLLEAIQYGVYPHIPGDGREGVATRDATVKVRSEDGRSVREVDLRPFIHDLPGNADTSAFTTPNASGSTSLAAAILEALEVGAEALLLDEDTSATNLLIRDARMQALVRKETITPLMDRVRELHRRLGVSTILVVGGSGDYLEVADHVVVMENYHPREVTEEGRRIAAELPTGRLVGDPAHPLRISTRCPLPDSFNPWRGRKEKIRARGLRELVYGEEVVDLAALEQLVDDSQARAIGVILRKLRERARTDLPLRALVEEVMEEVRRVGLRVLDPSPELAAPRSYEVAGAVNRLRSLRVRQLPPA